MEFNREEHKPVFWKPKENPCIVDTAGFEPFDCKIKRFILNGYVNQLRAEQFDSSDYKRMMSEVPLVLEFGDENEELLLKLDKINQIKNQIIIEKSVANIISDETGIKKDEKETILDTDLKDNTNTNV